MCAPWRLLSSRNDSVTGYARGCAALSSETAETRGLRKSITCLFAQATLTNTAVQPVDLRPAETRLLSRLRSVPADIATCWAGSGDREKSH